MTLDTERLTLLPITIDDHATLHALFTQPGVRRFIFDDSVITPEQTRAIIGTSEESFRTRGFGLWLAWLKAADADAAFAADPVGFGAFWHFREPPELELLYGVADDQLKRGYGREIARAIIDYGFMALGMSDIRASTDAAHTVSRRLLEEIGFSFVNQATVGGLDTVFYSISANRVRSARDDSATVADEHR